MKMRFHWSWSVFDRCVGVFAAMCTGAGAYFTYVAAFPPSAATQVHSSPASAMSAAAPWWALALIGLSAILLVVSLSRGRRAKSAEGNERLNTLESSVAKLLKVQTTHISTPELGNAVRNEMADLNNRIVARLAELEKAATAERAKNKDEFASIKEQIAVDLPNAGTVSEAFGNLDQAVHAQIERIRDEVNAIKAKDGAIHWDLLRLLDWAKARISVNVIRVLLEACPSVQETDCPVEADQRDYRISEIHKWLSSVQTCTGVLSWGGEIANAIPNARYDGEAALKQLQPEQRPTNIDPYVFADFYVAAHQCLLVKRTLENVVILIDQNELNKLEFISKNFEARHKNASAHA